mmetsp:Transcript_4107/g.8697  ORF Transcript_4107/g.8697 Transcript_4107/m.8697 type:complete len:585 (-) Transcript_4107:1653-3407(-)
MNSALESFLRSRMSSLDGMSYSMFQFAGTSSSSSPRRELESRTRPLEHFLRAARGRNLPVRRSTFPDDPSSRTAPSGAPHGDAWGGQTATIVSSPTTRKWEQGSPPMKRLVCSTTSLPREGNAVGEKFAPVTVIRVWRSFRTTLGSTLRIDGPSSAAAASFEAPGGRSLGRSHQLSATVPLSASPDGRHRDSPKRSSCISFSILRTSRRHASAISVSLSRPSSSPGPPTSRRRRRPSARDTAASLAAHSRGGGRSRRALRNLKLFPTISSRGTEVAVRTMGHFAFRLTWASAGQNAASSSNRRSTSSIKMTVRERLLSLTDSSSLSLSVQPPSSLSPSSDSFPPSSSSSCSSAMLPKRLPSLAPPPPSPPPPPPPRLLLDTASDEWLCVVSMIDLFSAAPLLLSAVLSSTTAHSICSAAALTNLVLPAPVGPVTRKIFSSPPASSSSSRKESSESYPCLLFPRRLPNLRLALPGLRRTDLCRRTFHCSTNSSSFLEASLLASPRTSSGMLTMEYLSAQSRLSSLDDPFSSSLPSFAGCSKTEERKSNAVFLSRPVVWSKSWSKLAVVAVASLVSEAEGDMSTFK